MHGCRTTSARAKSAAADALLPDALKNVNPFGIERLISGETTRASVG